MIFTSLFFDINSIRRYVFFWAHQLKSSADRLSAGTCMGLSASLGHQRASLSSQNAMQSQAILKSLQRARLAGFAQFSHPHLTVVGDTSLKPCKSCLYPTSMGRLIPES